MKGKFALCTVMLGFMLSLVPADMLAKAKPAARRAADTEQPSASAPRARTNKVAQMLKETNSKKFYVYSDKGARGNHYVPSGYMGDHGDIRAFDNWREKPYSGTSCIKFVYSNRASQGNRWAGVYWQNPANNWGARPGGYDLTGAKRLTFYAKGEKGGEIITEFKVGGISGFDYADSDAISIYDVELTKEWKKYTIDLQDLDLSYISGGFMWSTNLGVNPDGVTFYLDEIVYEF